MLKNAIDDLPDRVAFIAGCARYRLKLDEAGAIADKVRGSEDIRAAVLAELKRLYPTEKFA